MYKYSGAIFLFLAGMLLINSCAPGSMKYVDHTAGFLDGLWHGFISVVTLIISFFNCNVKMYETSNAGWWYDLGFLLGAAFAFSNVWFTSSKASKKSR